MCLKWDITKENFCYTYRLFFEKPMTYWTYHECCLFDAGEKNDICDKQNGAKCY